VEGCQEGKAAQHPGHLRPVLHTPH
jgi:hypothetical protein